MAKVMCLNGKNAENLGAKEVGIIQLLGARFATPTAVQKFLEANSHVKPWDKHPRIELPEFLRPLIQFDPRDRRPIALGSQTAMS